MKFVIATVAGIAVGVTAAYAESKRPQQMTETQMDQVYAGAPHKQSVIGMRVGGENNSEIIAVPFAAMNGVAQNTPTKAPKVTHPGNVESRLGGSHGNQPN
jgi:hypothetical protein